jgi:hypothetical protein
MDADYRCEMNYMSVDYKNGNLKYKEEFKGSKLDLALREVGESKLFVWSIKNGKAYVPETKSKKKYHLPLVRKGNKLFFDAPKKRVSNSDGSYFLKEKGFLDLKTKKYLATAHTYNKNRTIDIKYTVSALCVMKSD